LSWSRYRRLIRIDNVEGRTLYLKENELDEKVVVANFAIPTPYGAIQGKTQEHMAKHYSLDMILAAEKAHWEYKVYRDALPDDLTSVEKAYLDTLKDMHKRIKRR
jgi:hypothetical protein